MIRQKGQLYFDDENTSLTVEKINAMLDENFYSDCYPIALKHFLSLTDRITNCAPKDLQWLSMEYTVPFFANLIFRCKNKIFVVLFVKIDENSRITYPIDVQLFFSHCSRNNLIPTFLPFTKNHEIINIVDEKWALIDAEAYFNAGVISAVVPEEVSTDGFVEASDWELYNTAVMAIVEDLCNKQNIDQCLYQTSPGVDPAVCWIDQKNVFNWMVIRTEKESEQTRTPDEVLALIKKNNGIGHYGLCKISYPDGRNVYPRGVPYDLKFEIEDFN
ncbi:MAG: hypothetical protein KBS81_05055 [Spirochaetales bacterium]|nr:hypothetical protein [Candidatus Physcosoma equi]